jgi:superfamily II DNA or RNA helicase
MQPLRDYQSRATEAVRQHWQNGVRRVLLVSPTGSGKTRMGEELVMPFAHVVWFAHRRELIGDASKRLASSLGPLNVGVIAPGVSPSPFSRIQVATVQTALARDVRPPADLVVIDEAHHLVSDDWTTVLHAYPEANILLLTATPERQDGRGLDLIADVMVVAAEYSELLAAGHLTSVRVFRPEQILGNALAQDPVEAWLRYSEGSPGFAFFGSVKMAYENEHRMNSRGIRAAVVEQSTTRADRMQYIERLRDGDLDCICNVYTMTEGVDVPRARVCMLASACNHCGGFLQKTGRVIRPHESKPNAILIDLVGASILHGLPTEDRVYSLDGEPIKRRDVVPLKSCPSCGATIHAAYTACPECSWVFAAEKKRNGPRIFSLDLIEVFAGLHTPPDAKRQAYTELRAKQRAEGYELGWIQLQYKRVFLESCVISDATNDEKRTELAKLRELARSKGFKPKFANVRFKQIFGHWPS